MNFSGEVENRSGKIFYYDSNIWHSGIKNFALCRADSAGMTGIPPNWFTEYIYRMRLQNSSLPKEARGGLGVWLQSLPLVLWAFFDAWGDALNYPRSINPFEKTISTIKDHSRSDVFALWIGEFVARRIGVYVLRREIFSFHGAVSIDLTLFEALTKGKAT